MIDPNAEASETRPRRRFVLARLAEAVRRQQWVTVFVEIAIVVLGVAIGFQLTAWGQGRADRAQEQFYLRQLTEDFRATLAEAEQASGQQQAVERNAAAALRAYRMPQPPPLGALSAAIGGSFNFQGTTPILGTAQGIVSSGDLSLLRDDSLRAALPAYVERSRERRESVQVSVDLYGEAFARLLSATDVLELQLVRFTPSVVDSLAEVDATFPYPAGARRTPFPATIEDVLSDPDIYGALVTASIMNGALLDYQSQVTEDAARMLQLVERAQGVSE